VIRRLLLYLSLVRFELSVFALPCAVTGAFLAARGLPPGGVALGVVVAAVAARTAAMAFNRLADQRFDAANPRTAARELPAGAIARGEAGALVVAASAVFFVACSQINTWTLRLSPLFLGVTFAYSLTKRFTWLSHAVLGIALSLAPFGGWLAVRGTVAGYPWTLSAAVVLWVAGFDTVYACLDETFDRRAGLFSLPARFGRRSALWVARAAHLGAFVLFAGTGVMAHLGLAYAAGLVLAGAALLWQHLLVGPRDLSRIHHAFFTMNGAVSLLIFAATWLSLAVGG
jgi:4-hydroxybenzoate polyprenyltransferase